MTHDYLLRWKAGRGYYELLPIFRWLSDEECDWWEEQRITHQEANSWRTFRTPLEVALGDGARLRIPGETLPLRSEASLQRLLGLLPPVTSDGRPDKEAVRARVDMVDLYQRLFDVPPPRRTGSRYVQVKCFRHEDRMPSLSIDTMLKRTNCFSCNERADCFTLYQQVNNVPFYQAVAELDVLY